MPSAPAISRSVYLGSPPRPNRKLRTVRSRTVKYRPITVRNTISVSEESRFGGRSGGKRQRGFSLIEALAALTIFGMAVVVAAGFLDAHMSAARRLEARADLVRTAETVLESVRGGTLPLVSGEVDLTDEFQPLSSIRVRTRIVVKENDPQGLFSVRVETRALVRSEDMSVTIATQVWRP